MSACGTAVANACHPSSCTPHVLLQLHSVPSPFWGHSWWPQLYPPPCPSAMSKSWLHASHLQLLSAIPIAKLEIWSSMLCRLGITSIKLSFSPVFIFVPLWHLEHLLLDLLTVDRLLPLRLLKDLLDLFHLRSEAVSHPKACPASLPLSALRQSEAITAGSRSQSAIHRNQNRMRTLFSMIKLEHLKMTSNTWITWSKHLHNSSEWVTDAFASVCMDLLWLSGDVLATCSVCWLHAAAF